VAHIAFMFVKASVELTLASNSFSKSVTGLGPEGPGSCPEIACSAVARAAGVGAGKEVGGMDESEERPLVAVCPQTRATLINRNRTSLFSGRIFMSRIIGIIPLQCNSALNFIFEIF